MNNFCNPLWEGADPYVMFHDGYYYFTHCYGDNKIYLSKSSTLIDRGDMKTIYEFPDGKWNSSMNWGPAALFKWDDGKWYMYYCAADGPKLEINNINHRLGILRSKTDNPMGPYEDLTPDEPLNSGGCWAIAAQPFQDFKGKWYIAWSGWENPDDQFPQHTYIAKMENPWTIGERVKISTPDQYWEKSVAPIQEGHTVIRRGNKLIMFYSANASSTDKYCLGMLVCEEENVLDPASWVKYKEPVFKETAKIFGPGGAAITKSPDGKEDWLVYHAAQWSGTGWRRYVNAQKFTWGKNDIPEFGEPVPYGQPMPLPSGDEGISEAGSYECIWKSIQRFDWTTFGGDWSIEGGGKGRRFVLKVPVEYSKAVVRKAIYSDFNFQCTINLGSNEEGTDAGLIFRVTEPYIGKYGMKGYYVAADAFKNEIRLERVTGNEKEVLAAKSIKIERYTDYLVKINANGSIIKVYFDDMTQPVLEIKDSTYTYGCIGIRAYKQYASWKELTSESVKSLN